MVPARPPRAGCNRAFRRLLLLPPTHPNALLYLRSSEDGLGLPRLSDQVNLSKVYDCPSAGLLHRATLMSGGQFLQPDQGEFIGPFTLNPVWGSTLGALGPDIALRLAPTAGPVFASAAPHSAYLAQLLRTLRRLDLSTWADLTVRTRTVNGPGWTSLPSSRKSLSPPVRLSHHHGLEIPAPRDPANSSA